MKKTLILFFLLAGVLLFAACSQKKITQAEQPQPAVEQQKAEMSKAEEVRTPDVQPQIQASGIKAADVSAQAEKDTDFELTDVHFDYDRYDIRPEERAVLENTASWLMKNRDSAVSIEGHCDERGTNEYNLALGDRRANSIRKFLTASGVSSARIRTVSYGEEKPVCAEHDDTCWQKNRRAHFVLN